MKTPSQKHRAKIKKLRKESDKIWQQIIQKLHPICEGCKKEKSQVGHHFIEKSLSNALRYDINNGIGLSNKCHFLLHTRSDGNIYANIILSRGQEWVDYINEQRKKPTKTTLKWYESHLKILNKELSIIQKNEKKHDRINSKRRY